MPKRKLLLIDGKGRLDETLNMELGFAVTEDLTRRDIIVRIAADAGVGEDQVDQVLDGEAQPTEPLLQAFANVLGIPLVRLLGAQAAEQGGLPPPPAATVSEPMAAPESAA